jgi:hypothetical protein
MPVRYLAASAVLDRLGWILDRLNGTTGWGADAAEVLAADLSASERLQSLAENLAAVLEYVTR